MPDELGGNVIPINQTAADVMKDRESDPSLAAVLDGDGILEDTIMAIDAIHRIVRTGRNSGVRNVEDAANLGIDKIFELATKYKSSRTEITPDSPLE